MHEGSGGQRRRRQKVVAAGYGLAPLGSVEGIRRVLEIAVLDVMSLANSVGRARVLIAAAQAATRPLEVEAALTMSASDLKSHRRSAMVRPGRRVAPHNEAGHGPWPYRQMPPPPGSSESDVAS